MAPHDPHTIHQAVEARYARIARERGSCCAAEADPAQHRGCSAPQGVGSGPVAEPASASCGLGYSVEELASLPPGADLALGSGNPVAAAALQPGQTVLDLGSGAGIDCFLAARKVGSNGRVIGVDMTAAMLERARGLATAAGYDNVSFLAGQIERLPVGDASVDRVISNCVVNLSPDKPAVWRESYRVLRPGGWLVISDIVASDGLPAALGQRLDLACGCIAGAAPIEQVRADLAAAGFIDIRIEPQEQTRRMIEQWLAGSSGSIVSALIAARRPA